MNVFLGYAARRFVQLVFVIVTGITLAFLIAHLLAGRSRRAEPVADDGLQRLRSARHRDAAAVPQRALWRQRQPPRPVPDLLAPRAHRRLRAVALGLPDAGDDHHPAHHAVDVRPARAGDDLRLDRRQHAGGARRLFPRQPAPEGDRHGRDGAAADPDLHHRPDPGDLPRLPVADPADQRWRAGQSRAGLRPDLYLERRWCTAPCRP